MTCIICSAEQASSPVTVDAIRSFARLYLHMEGNQCYLPKFGSSKFLIFCTGCLRKVEFIHEMFTKLDNIRNELNEYRIAVQDELMNSLKSCELQTEPNSLRREIIQELHMDETEGLDGEFDDGCDLELDLRTEEVTIEPEINMIKEEVEEYIVGDTNEYGDSQSSYSFQQEDDTRVREICPTKRKRSEESSFEETKLVKPPFTLLQLISQSILSRPSQRATIRHMYNYMTTNFSYYRNQATQKHCGWQNSVRHTLSVNNRMFRKVPDAGIEGGRGWWEIDPAFKEKLVSQAFIVKVRTEQGSKCRESQGN